MRLQILLAYRYMVGRKLRTFLTTLAVVFGTLVIFMMGIVLPSMMKAFQANMLAASGQVDISITHKTGESYPVRQLNTVKGINGVGVAAGSLSRTINLPDKFFGRDAKTSVSAVTLTGIEPRPAQLLHTYNVTAGRFLRVDDQDQAVISTSLAENLGLGVGDKLKLPTTGGALTLKVVGLLPARTLPGNEEVLVTLAEAQKLFDLDGRINTIEANLTSNDTAQRQAIEAEIRATLGADYTFGSLGSGSELFASLQTAQSAFNLMGFLSLFMGGFIIFNTFRTIVAERRHDIGMLRSIGASRGTIIGLILAESLLQGLIGSLIGMTVGYLLAAGLLQLMSPIMMQFLHVPMGGAVVSIGIVITTLLLGVGVTVLAGLFPALSASRVTPLEALRPNAVDAPRRAGLTATIIGVVLVGLALAALISNQIGLIAVGGLLLLIGLVLITGALVRPIAAAFGALISMMFARDGTGSVAQGNLTRQPGRVAVTASATMVGLAIIVAMVGLVWSLTGGFLGILQRSLGSDYLLMPPSVALWQSDIGASKNMAERLRQLPGVGVVSTMRFAAAQVNGKPVSLLAIDPVLYPKVASLTFMQGDAQSAMAGLAGERTMVANGVFAAQAGLKLGDTVRVSTPTGAKEYTIVGVGSDYLNTKIITAYISQASLLKDFRKSEDVFIQVNLAPNANAAAVENQMKTVLKDYPQFSLISGKKYFEDNKALFNTVFAFYYVLVAVLAVPSLIALLNTLAIGVIERTREIGMTRAIGATRRQVRRMVIVEAVLLAGIGTAFGLPAGLYMGYLMLLGMSTAGFPVEYAFPVGGLIAATVIGLVFGYLSGLLPAKQAAGMNIIQALRYE
jgi:putative ABC transport system permease protein